MDTKADQVQRAGSDRAGDPGDEQVAALDALLEVTR